MTEVYVGSRVVLLDNRNGMVYAIEKNDSESLLDWTFRVDVDGESIDATLVALLEVGDEADWDTEKDRNELRGILNRHAARTEALIEQERARLIQIHKIQWLLSDQHWS